ncbi:MAG: hypothetical protein HIU92_02960 [Proteobacteria bacterium]|nr:hypothetical protein [Pseudomonadota bacterium]
MADVFMLDRLTAMQAAGKLGAAEAAFLRITRATPGHLHGWLGLGYCAILRCDPAGARDAFQTAAALPLDQEEAAIDCARGFSQLGESDRARAILAGISDTVGRQMALGEIEERHGGLTEALDRYRRAAALDPRADQPLRKLIGLCRRAQHFAEALEAAGRLAAIDPRHEAAAWHYRGLIRRDSNDRQGALEAFGIASERAPTIDHYAIDWSRDLQAACREAEAEALLHARAPSFAVRLHLGEIALARRDHDAALHLFSEAHVLEPARPDPWARSAQAEADRGAFNLALGFSDRIEALGPQHRLVALRSRLAVHRAAGRETDALDTLKAMAAVSPGDAVIAADLVRQYRSTGDGETAREAVHGLLARNPADPAVLSAAADQALSDEDRETALGLCRRLVAASPEIAGHHIRLARLLRDLDRAAEASAVMAVAEARFGPNAAIRSERIRHLRDSGRSYEALQAARSAQAAFPADFHLWLERFRAEVRLAPIACVRDCLAVAPARSRDHEVEVLAAHAQLARRQHDPAAAIHHLEAALRLKPHHRGVLTELFNLYLQSLNLDGAAACLRRKALLEVSERRLRGITTNPSQSPQGQLLNEYRMDRRAIGDLARARALPPAEEVEAVLAQVRARPTSIPTAFSLIQALQRAGLLNRERPAEATAARRAIPRTIVQFWDAAELSADLLDFSASWRACNADHRHYLFNAGTARNYLRRYFPPAVVSAFLRCPDATTQSDLFRLAFLLRDGGIWADMDDRCLATFRDLIPGEADACFWVEAGSICNNFMAAAPGHPVLRLALILAVEAINRGDRDKVWLLTGPGLVSRAFAVCLAGSGDGWRERLARIAVFGEFDLPRFVAVHCQPAYKRSGRNWTETAFARREAARAAA